MCSGSIDIKDKHLECDWPKEHDPNWAHVNEASQILWGDNGVSYPAKVVSFWLSLPKEMQPLVHVPHIDRMNL
jgi:hypothetical protein